MKTTAFPFVSNLGAVWSCHDFAGELGDYATPVITRETRRGVSLLSLVALLFLGMATAMSAVFELGSAYTYTYSVLCALALHIYLSSAKVEQLRALYLLAMLLLVVCASSLALVARALGLRKHDLAMRFHLERAQRELTDLVNRDHLTGAWNRRHIERDFDRVVAHHHALGAPCWFGLFDIDRFKSINDTFGHGCGDEVLRAVHAAFSSLAGDVEYLARLGGDEFALLMCGVDAPARAQAALASISANMATPLPGGVTPTVSLGLVRLPLPERGALNFDGAYKLADELLYAAKHAGGNAIRTNEAAGARA